MKKELDVVAALIEQEGTFLLCQRKAADRYGLFWEFPGGGVEEGETLAYAIEREIKEELGVVIEAGEMIAEFYDEDDDLKIKVSLLSCTFKEGKPKAEECRAFGFFGLEEMKRIALAPVDKKIFAYLKQIL